MPLYTVRTTLSLNPMVSRGDNTSSMSHHFDWPADDLAIAEFPEFIDHFSNTNVADRFTCARGPAQHEQTLYRRDITNPRSFERLATQVFTLAAFQEYPFTLDFGSGPIGFTLEETPVYDHRRGAILVTQVGYDARCVKRTYVGPVSPIYLRGFVSVLGDAPYAIVGVLHPLLFDYPPNVGDTVDEWRLEVADTAADHVQNLRAALDTGIHVLPSWKHAVYSPPRTTVASLTRADLRSRGIRGGQGTEYTT